MNFTQYLDLVQSKNIREFTFFQNNKPHVLYSDKDSEYLSERILFKEDMEGIINEIQKLSSSKLKEGEFYFSGKKFNYSIMSLNDASSVQVWQEKEIKLDWEEMSPPGYLSDWAQSKKGIILFYGDDINYIQFIKNIFFNFRLSKTKGKSLFFLKFGQKFIESEESKNFYITSLEEKSFLDLEDQSYQFDYYSFAKEIDEDLLKKSIKLSDGGAFISLNSNWSNLKSVLYNLSELFSKKSDIYNFENHILGFVGIKKTSKNLPVFELLPFGSDINFENIDQINFEEKIRKEGISFNQSLQNLVLKRKINLEEAYELSPNLEELNKFLDAAGV